MWAAPATVVAPAALAGVVETAADAVVAFLPVRTVGRSGATFSLEAVNTGDLAVGAERTGRATFCCPLRAVDRLGTGAVLFAPAATRIDEVGGGVTALNIDNLVVAALLGINQVVSSPPFHQ